MGRKRFIWNAIWNAKDSYGTQKIPMGRKTFIGGRKRLIGKDSYGTQQIHMESKRFISDAKDSYGTQEIPTERKRFIWNAKDS